MFDLCANGLFKRFFRHELGLRFAHERALSVGLFPHWTVPEIGKLAGAKREARAIKAQAAVRSFLTRQRLKRAAERARQQRETVAYLILRAQALASAKSIIELVLEQVPAVVAHRRAALQQVATNFGRTVVTDAVQKLHERGVPLQRLAIARVKRGLSRSIVATAKHRAFTVLYTSRRATRKIMKRGIAKARTWIINKGLVDRRFRESQLVLPPMQDFVNDADSVSSVDSDPHGERYSTAPERAFWPCVVALDDGWHALLLVLGLA